MILFSTYSRTRQIPLKLNREYSPAPRRGVIRFLVKKSPPLRKSPWGWSKMTDNGGYSPPSPRCLIVRCVPETTRNPYADKGSAQVKSASEPIMLVR
jgi:hypothetical protein